LFLIRQDNQRIGTSGIDLQRRLDTEDFLQRSAAYQPLGQDFLRPQLACTSIHRLHLTSDCSSFLLPYRPRHG
ncbi:hypothetical protein, partial [Brevundimonas sp.]|uniref:hypothetical protein n=1 Tax=Brevundimonas sp. TaxID=1871086 RepID=UPI002732BC46